MRLTRLLAESLLATLAEGPSTMSFSELAVVHGRQHGYRRQEAKRIFQPWVNRLRRRIRAYAEREGAPVYLVCNVEDLRKLPPEAFETMTEKEARRYVPIGRKMEADGFRIFTGGRDPLWECWRMHEHLAAHGHEVKAWDRTGKALETAMIDEDKARAIIGPSMRIPFRFPHTVRVLNPETNED